ncbi:phage protein Gp36 family protein [Sphingobacterium multivorum]|uniref:phage protein Gp36 family protein n=1 Tax=Sphingobacterium multivorum TaxID=28454 RepID=UPI003DA39DBD
MSFITKEELKTVSTLEIVNLITGTEDSIVEDIIEESVELMENYLYQYYDTDTIFSAIGQARKKIVVRLLKKIVIHEIFVRRSRVMNQTVKDGYDEAIALLDKAGSGDIKLDLPSKIVDSDGDGVPDKEATFLKLGSNKNYPNHW